MAAGVTERKFEDLRGESDATEKCWPGPRPSSSLSQAALWWLPLRPQPTEALRCQLVPCVIGSRRRARLRELRAQGHLQVRLGFHHQDGTSAPVSLPAALTAASGSATLTKLGPQHLVVLAATL